MVEDEVRAEGAADPAAPGPAVRGSDTPLPDVSEPGSDGSAGSDGPDRAEGSDAPAASDGRADRSPGEPDGSDAPDGLDRPGGPDPADDTDTPVGEPPGWLAQVPYFLVLATMAAGIVVVAAAYFKRGPALIAIALLLGAAFRFFLPPERVGLLVVRRRWIDVTTFVTLAVLLIVLAWVAPQL